MTERNQKDAQGIGMNEGKNRITFLLFTRTTCNNFLNVHRG